MTDPKPLTPKQEAFIREYLVDLNGTAAAERAGYGGGKASTAVTASRLLRDPKIASRISEARGKRAEKVEITAERVLAEVSRLALADLAGAFNEDGSLKPLKDIPEELRRCISSVDLVNVPNGDGGSNTITKVRFCDKVKSLELLMKHLGMLRDKLEVSGEGGEPLQIVVKTYKEYQSAP
jgi:phage terminase small subunit